MPASSRKWTNIRRTIQSRMGNSVVVNAYEAPIYHDYSHGDPESIRDPSGQKYRAWVETTFLEQMAGRKGSATLQVDCYSRVGEEGDVTSDPFGMFVEDLAEASIDLFTGLSLGGGHKASFDVMDYSDISNPVSTGMCVYMINSSGHIGEPEDRKRLDFYQDLRRVTITLRFQLIQDMAGQAAFYTS